MQKISGAIQSAVVCAIAFASCLSALEKSERMPPSGDRLAQADIHCRLTDVYGRVHVLTDTDGDGFEDKVELSFDLGGAHGEWTRQGDVDPAWTGWLPHIDSNVIDVMTADDFAEVWLSRSEDPAKESRIVSMNRWTPSRVWEKYPEQTSKPIRLEAGRRYYIEALQMEAAFDDCLAVG
jgi:hypothetical protein